MDKQEAIKNLKGFHDKSALFSVRTALETVLPELKESEDERIRKTLLESFDYQIKESYPDKVWVCGVKLKEIVAWLEKQGEQKSAEWSKEDKSMLSDCISAIHAADYYDTDYKIKMEVWLKSLKQRIGG